jgi:hypothetical protein
MDNNEVQHWPVFPKHHFAAGCCPMQHGIVGLVIAVGMTGDGGYTAIAVGSCELTFFGSQKTVKTCCTQSVLLKTFEHLPLVPERG